MEDIIISQTQNWIKSVVIDCNFCPFAAKAMSQKTIRYVVMPNSSVAASLEKLVEELEFLDTSEEIETTFLIFPHNFADFDDYLDFVELAEELTFEQDYEGIYQIASFHPDYCFEDAEDDDPANFTNRSIYPMLHLLREESISNALKYFLNPEAIPERNMKFAREKGLQYMQMLRSACM